MAKALVRENFVAGDILLFGEANNYAKNSNSILKTLVAGENITLGKPCFVADGSVSYEEILQTDFSYSVFSEIYSTTNIGGQTFRTKASPYGFIILKEVQAYLVKTGTPAGNIIMNIYAVDANHKPTGASLGSASITTASVSGSDFYTFAFNVALSPATEYAIILSLSNGDVSNYVKWYGNSGTDGTPIPDGLILYSSNSGSTWSLGTAGDRAIKIKYSYKFGIGGSVYHSFAGDKNRSYFDCISQETKSISQNCLCQFGNSAEGFTGLVAGGRYFLEDFHTQIASIITGSSDDPIYTGNWIAQTFTTAADQVAITKLSLSFRRNNNPSGDITISIRATSAGLPTGSDLVSRVYADSQMLSSSFRTIIVEFDAPLAVSPSTVYAVVVRISGGDINNRIEWTSDTGNPYAGGQKATSSNSGGSWTAVSGSDMKMLVYGYSKKVLTAPVSWQVLVGQAISATELFIEKEDHVIYKQAVNETNTDGASSSCETTYAIPTRTKRIVLNISNTHNGSVADMAGQIILTKGEIMTGKMQQNYGSGGDNIILTATWSGDSLTINAYRQSGTANFTGDIIYIGR